MKHRINNILLLVFLIGIAYSLTVFYSWSEENQSNQEIKEQERKHLVKEEDVTYLDPTILEDNSDTVFWIQVEGTSIDYPVVQTKNNYYYLERDFFKKENSAGWIFLDCRNKMDDQNIVIYGHHRRDGSMFGTIDSLFDSSFYEKNSQITLMFEKEMITYEIFSVYKTNPEDDYVDTNFENFSEKVEELRKKSEISVVEKIPEDTSQIITLSTCHNNNRDRLVVHGYKKI